jgi:hypothetical protein
MLVVGLERRAKDEGIGIVGPVVARVADDDFEVAAEGAAGFSLEEFAQNQEGIRCDDIVRDGCAGHGVREAAYEFVFEVGEFFAFEIFVEGEGFWFF